eukprot:TRINITY_DN46420_c0_g1_i1.p1 TRINITY_DN46420_c0_g1~~TRINITY_DN46420_c0_g1_i1.p1  ORF type:complete len:585 (+),score=75.54 TRINITY_DN46420_c0_g1_i1:50-1756(+)
MVDGGSYAAAAASEEDEEGGASSGSDGASPRISAPRRRRRWGRLGTATVAASVALAFVAVSAVLLRERERHAIEARPRGGPAESPESAEAALQAARTPTMEDLPRKRRWVELQGGHRVPKVEGNAVEQENPVHSDECAQTCLKTNGCKYVITCNGKCYMKDLAITPYVETEANSWCTTWVYTDEPYLPPNKALTRPSTAPEFSFYLYRTQGPEQDGGDYPLENVNAASASGVLWYLHNEMIKECNYGNTAGMRRFGVTRIRRFKITYKAPQTLYDKGMNFGTLCSFDSGECTGPHRHGWSGTGSGWNSKDEWEEYGFYVGCAKLGDYPHQEWPSGRRYLDAVWYSLPGACPTMNFHKATTQCKDELPGGRCDFVTGQGNCTYKTEPAGEIDIDELVGITPQWSNRAEFCQAGCVEGNPAQPLRFGQDDGLSSRFTPGFRKTGLGRSCAAGTILTTRSQCEEAARSVGHSVTKINYDGAFGHLPYGCAIRDGQLIWSSGHASKMHPSYEALCFTQKQCTMWWGDIWNPLENKDRLEQMLDKFHTKYPKMPREDQMRPPLCDFSRSKYTR